MITQVDLDKATYDAYIQGYKAGRDGGKGVNESNHPGYLTDSATGKAFEWFCPKCDESIDNQSPFCKWCGAKIDWEESHDNQN